MLAKTSRPLLLAVLSSLVAIPQAWSLAVTVPPSLRMNPNGITPLAGVVNLTTDVPSRVTLRLTRNAHPLETWTVAFPEFLTDHAVPVLGLKPRRVYAVEVTVTDQAGRSLTVSPAIAAVTPRLPANFPTIEVLVSRPDRMEPGFTLLDQFKRSTRFDGPAYTMILDQSGAVVWYGLMGRIVVQLPNGNLRFKDTEKVIERDLLGNVVSVVTLDDPGLGTHHELATSEEGTYLSLTHDSVVVDGFPTSTTDPTAPTETAPVQDNPVVEFAPDGSFLQMWRLTEILDTTRIGYNSLVNTREGADWVHANTVVHDPRDDSLLVSCRHQDAVVKFSRDSGGLRWILAPHCNWGARFQPFLLQPVGVPFQWSFGQHAPRYTPDGTLLLFDNGNFRACPFDGSPPMEARASYSRAVEYAIDEAAMTVRQFWEYPGPGEERIFSVARGDADQLPGTGNVLITFASVTFTDGVSSAEAGHGSRHGRIVEVTHATPSERVFDVRIYDGRGRVLGHSRGLEFYRSSRIPSLYGPAVSVVRGPGVAVEGPPDRAGQAGENR